MDTEAFLNAFHERLETTSSSTGSRPDVEMDVVVLGSDEANLIFGHVGAEFAVPKGDVIRIEEVEVFPNMFGRGVCARVLFRAEAQIFAQGSYSAHDLTKGLPFALVRPTSSSKIEVPTPSEAELRWRESLGAFDRSVLLTQCTSFCPIHTFLDTSTFCGTPLGIKDDTNSDGKTDGIWDDTNYDDSISDSIS